ncbi:MAG: hypothetical protein NTX57_18310 [Armatimonadetes bacterium]|jgi:hypothetical protein|nr:hypothetical protein [Armatimonadota bacterium]
MARLFVLCLIVGGVLLWLGMRRFKTSQQQGVLLILVGVLLNVWWLAFLVMDSLKTGARWRERKDK